MDKNKVIFFAIEKLVLQLDSLKNAIEREDEKKKSAPSAMQSWSDNTRFEKEVLIKRLEDDQADIKKHINFLKNLKPNRIDRVKQGALIKTENLKTKKITFYFISLFAGLEFEINDTQVIFLSENSPIIKLFLNKKQGDQIAMDFNLKEQTIKILSIE